MKTNAIIFSKNRTLQLKSLLLSLRDYSDFNEENMYIVYVADEQFSYQSIMDEFKCQFIKETDFLKHMKDIVDQPGIEYTLFAVDDLIFRDDFSINDVEALMDSRQDIEAFCFRMGDNIDCPPKPQFEEVDDQFLLWDTSTSVGKYWNYFWDLSSSLYRKELILKYISRCRPDKETFPNPFEYHYYNVMPSTLMSKRAKIYQMLRYPFEKKHTKTACYKKSKALTQGVNLVAEIVTERTEHFTPEALHQKMLDGYVVDYKYLKDLDIREPQPGHHFFKLMQLNNG